MKKISLCLLIPALCALNSCKIGNNNDNEAPVPPGMVRVDLSKWHLLATIDIPDTTRKIYGFIENGNGSLLVHVGTGFYLTINVSGETVAMKKSDISGDDLNKPKTWVIADSNNLVYSTEKDTNAFANAKEEFHLYCKVKKGNSTFFVQDLNQGTDGTVYTFSKEQAQTMFTSANSLTPITPQGKE